MKQYIKRIVLKMLKKLVFTEFAKMDNRIRELESRDDITPNSKEMWQKALTELPEKWAILADKYSIVHNWFNDKLNRQVYIDTEPLYFHFPEIERDICTCNNVRKGYTEITTDQFRKWVLKEDAAAINNGQWAEIVERPKEIDWSVPGQLVTSGVDIILTCEHKGHKKSFTGIVVHKIKGHGYDVGEYGDDWEQCLFKPYTGPAITLSNE